VIRIPVGAIILQGALNHRSTAVPTDSYTTANVNMSILTEILLVLH